MQAGSPTTEYDPAETLDAAFRHACNGLREVFRQILECDRRDRWRTEGCRDMAHWLAVRFGISQWAASKWVKAAYAIDGLPAVSAAFENGELPIEKVVELTRFATIHDEEKLIKWAQKVTPATVRAKADRANRPDISEANEAHDSRYIEFWKDELMLRFEGAVTLEEGAKLEKAVNRCAEKLSRSTDGLKEETDCSMPALRADALVALASARIEQDADQDAATVVVHVDLQDLRGGAGGGEIEGGGVLTPEMISQLRCDGRTEWVVADSDGKGLGIGRASRRVPPWMLRQLRYRDRGCTFPGCGTRHFTRAHHVRFWELLEPTDLDNLTLVCHFHHKVIHRYGWRVELADNHEARWFRPDGRPVRAGPGKTVPDRSPPVGAH